MQIGLGITVPKMGILGGDAGVGLGVGFFPGNLFLTGAQGAWYDPSDFSTLYQTSTGTTPVTAVEQPVGLMLDRSRGLVLGSELVTNGDFASGTTGWTDISGAWAVTGGALVGTSVGASAYGPFANSTAVTAGRSYQATYTITITSGGLAARVGNTQSETYTASGTYTRFFVADTTGVTAFQVRASGSGFTGSIDNISVRELPGNHAVQATSASRPVLRARYNLLTYSEQFNDGAWTKLNTTVTANAGVAPDGTTTADKLVENSATDFHTVRPTTSVGTVGATEILSVYAKAAERSWFALQLGSSRTAYFNLSAGTIGTTSASTTATITALANGWYRCSIAGERVATQGNQIILASGDNVPSYTGDGTSGILIWGEQLLTAADQTSTGGAYQRIAAATDYDVSNPVWRPYLAFDGVDDFFNLASAISITTDMTVVRGFGRSAAGIQSAGLGTSGAEAPAEMAWNTSNDIVIGRLGTPAATVTSANTTTGYYVSTNRRDATNEIGRLSGTQILTRASITVAGTLTDLGRRQTGTVYNSGPVYGLIVLDRALTGSELTATEQWMAGKTGVTL